MANSWTLTSLAMLKVKIDFQHGDYLDYLEPFVLEVLRKTQPPVIKDEEIATCLLEEFGLRIPHRGIQLVLGRIRKRGTIEKKEGLYILAKEIKDTGIDQRRSLAKQRIDILVHQLAEYAAKEHERTWTDEYAAEVLKSYLSTFGVDCLKTYIHRTALPDLAKKTPQEIRVVHAFVRHSHRTSVESFENLIVVIKGHMLANALLCPDLESLQKKFDQVTFFLDTGFLLGALGLQAEPENKAAQDLVLLLRELRGKLAVFDNTVAELTNLLKAAEDQLKNPHTTLRLAVELRNQGRSVSDITLVRSQLELLLEKRGIVSRPFPKHVNEFQIDEVQLDSLLKEAMEYRRDEARTHDVDCIRSIFTLRRNSRPKRLEDALAVFVTTNRSVARVAFEFGKQFEHSREVSAVITDFSLANVAWLKAPLRAPDLPEHEILAACYAALEPSEILWTKYLAEVDKLQSTSVISESDHAFLRLDTIAREELMDLTLGEDEALTSESVIEILERAKQSIVQEAQAKTELLGAENRDLRQKQSAIISTMYHNAEVAGDICAWTVGIVCTVAALVAGGALPFLFHESVSRFQMLTWSVGALVVFGVGLGLNDLIFGHSIKDIFQFTRRRSTTGAFNLLRRLNGLGSDTVDESL